MKGRTVEPEQKRHKLCTSLQGFGPLLWKSSEVIGVFEDEK